MNLTAVTIMQIAGDMESILNFLRYLNVADSPRLREEEAAKMRYPIMAGAAVGGVFISGIECRRYSTEFN